MEKNNNTLVSECYVLFSGNIKNPMTEFTEGSNTYRIKPIIMKQKNADEVLNTLKEKLWKKLLMIWKKVMKRFKN
mgnify:CR=1 FL=1